MERKINFGAGPAKFPDSVLKKAQEAILEYENTGMSILEIPHRGKHFLDIIQESKALVRELCSLDESYEVLWMQGGGRMQFVMLPLNFLGDNRIGGYIDSGHWSDEAYSYAQYYCKPLLVASSKDCQYRCLPEISPIKSDDLRFVHITTNNTIYGTQWNTIPQFDCPLIADMSSDIFSRHRDYSQFDFFYAVAQKNLGCAGNTMVVAKKSFLKRGLVNVPPMLNYLSHSVNNSILNTANVFGVYVSLLMLRWIKEIGLDNIENNNRLKMQLLYNVLDKNSSFMPYVQNKEHRSWMNVTFTAKTPEIEQELLSKCDENNITGIKGHRTIGGFRVSLYNAVEIEEVNKLAEMIDCIQH